MDFKQLKELSVEDQIEWLNNKLLEGITVSEIRDLLGVGEKALQKYIKSIAYKYDQKQKQYVLKDNQQGKSIAKVVQNPISMDKCVDLNQQDNSSTLALQLKNSEYQKFIHIMNTYDELQNQVQELLRKQELEDNIIDITPPKLEINPMEGTIISKTYKFNSKVIDEFTQFCQDNKNYKVQDIISLALREFLDKYRN